MHAADLATHGLDIAERAVDADDLDSGRRGAADEDVVTRIIHIGKLELVLEVVAFLRLDGLRGILVDFVDGDLLQRVVELDVAALGDGRRR